MNLLPIPLRIDAFRDSLAAIPDRQSYEIKGLSLGHGELSDFLEVIDAQYIHLSSSACLSGLSDDRIPSAKQGGLLPLGELEELGISPTSGEGGGDENCLKYHAVSVCNVVDIEDSMMTLESYAMTNHFIQQSDFPVLFAIHNTGEITSHLDDINANVIDPVGKMDACEFAICRGVGRTDIKAIIVPAAHLPEANRILAPFPDLQSCLVSDRLY